MKKVISFSLFKATDEWERQMETSYQKYKIGFIENLKLIQKYYPNWVVFLYHDSSLSSEDILNLQKIGKFESVLITDKNISAMQWRFLPNDDPNVELFISRDIDSRITDREVTSVNEWIDSNKILHIMRDHPHHHYEILGGMWGMKRQPDFNMLENCRIYNQSRNYSPENDWYDKWWDMNFLRDIIYPKYKQSSYVNASYHKIEPWSIDFTEERKNQNFVGEIFDQQNIRQNHYKLL